MLCWQTTSQMRVRESDHLRIQALESLCVKGGRRDKARIWLGSDSLHSSLNGEELSVSRVGD